MTEDFLQKPLGVIVRDRPDLTGFLEAYGLDYCCGGQQTLAAACREKNIPPTPLLEVLAKPAPEDFPKEVPEHLPPAALIDYILEHHHTFTWKSLERLPRLADKAARAHGQTFAIFHRLQEEVEKLSQELSPHLRKEEEVLFPWMRRILENTPKSPAVKEILSGPLQCMRLEHDNAGEKLHILEKEIPPAPPQEASCPTAQALWKELFALTADLKKHIHLENNVLFPFFETAS